MVSKFNAHDSNYLVGYNLHQNSKSMFKAMEKLSSGLRINRASDDPAGLVISEQLRAQIASMYQEIENINANISKYSTADSLMMTMRDQLKDLRDLAVAASNTAFNDENVKAAYSHSAQLVAEGYNRIIDNSAYNGAKLFDGTAGSLADISKLSGINLTDTDSIEQSLAIIDSAEQELNAAQVDIGSTVKNQFESERNTLSISRNNLIAAESSIRDADFVSEYTNFIIGSFKTKLGLMLLAHSKMNAETVMKIFK